MKTVSAYTARTNFGELLNEVYYQGEEFVVERKGKPLAKISRIDSTESIKKNRQLRKNKSPSRILLLAGSIKSSEKTKNLNIDKIRDKIDYSNL